ncbi:MAG: serine hydrolase, partial [Bacteroidales bacterium]|nr:serine hydrolase [Bacteroidales bacterium]
GLDMHASPATSFRYKNSDPHLLSAIIQEKAGKTTRDWAKDILLDKIGITRLEWRTYKDGVTFGGFGILSTPREMGKLGQLVANGGMWNGEQIVSQHWIDEMTRARIFDTPTEFANMAFCYLWWKDIERGAVFTMGHGGQYIIVNKDKNLTIVITSEQHPAFEFSLLPNDVISIYDRINNIAE